MILRVFMEILGIIFLWIGIAFSVLFHETGHMIGYKLAKGKENWIIQVGFGKTLIKTKNFDIRAVPFSGVFYNPVPGNTYTKIQALLCAAGGPVFSLVLILAPFVLRIIPFYEWSSFIDYYEPTWNFIRTYNLIIFLSAIIPIRYPAFFPIIGGMESDGMQVLKVLQNKNCL